MRVQVLPHVHLQYSSNASIATRFRHYNVRFGDFRRQLKLLPSKLKNLYIQTSILKRTIIFSIGLLTVNHISNVPINDVNFEHYDKT